MTVRLSLAVTRRAATEIREAADWWHEHRPAAPQAFSDEIAKAFELIQTQPKIGAVAVNVRLPKVRRIHLSRVRYYLYYRVTGDPARIEVLALWHTSRLPDLAL